MEMPKDATRDAGSTLDVRQLPNWLIEVLLWDGRGHPPVSPRTRVHRGPIFGPGFWEGGSITADDVRPEPRFGKWKHRAKRAERELARREARDDRRAMLDAAEALWREIVRVKREQRNQLDEALGELAGAKKELRWIRDRFIVCRAQGDMLEHRLARLEESAPVDAVNEESAPVDAVNQDGAWPRSPRPWWKFWARQ